VARVLRATGNLFDDLASGALPGGLGVPSSNLGAPTTQISFVQVVLGRHPEIGLCAKRESNARAVAMPL
jgi:hypothetical protein